jgi:hypothetical protein
VVVDLSRFQPQELPCNSIANLPGLSSGFGSSKTTGGLVVLYVTLRVELVADLTSPRSLCASMDTELPQ